MAILRVPDSYASIEDAVAAAQPGDVIDIGDGYGAEVVEVETTGLTFRASEAVTGVALIVKPGVRAITIDGAAPVEVRCETGDYVTVNGGAGANVIDVGDSRGDVDGGGGDDLITANLENWSYYWGNTIVDGGAGKDTLVVDLSNAFVQGSYFSNFFYANYQFLSFQNIENLEIIGGAISNRFDLPDLEWVSIDSGGGDDGIYAYGSNGVVQGGAGDDRLYADDLGNLEVQGVETLEALTSGPITGTIAQFSVYSLITGAFWNDSEDQVGLRLVGGGGDLDLQGRIFGDVDVSAAALTGAVDLRASTGDDALSGSGYDDTLNGGSGDDVLTGAGGGDFLTGSEGRDVFVIGAAPGTWREVDTIMDFASVDDVISLDQDGFASLNLGVLSEDAFKDVGVAGATVDGTDRIIYNSSNGALYYDADGAGSAERVKLALLWNGATIDHEDILVV